MKFRNFPVPMPRRPYPFWIWRVEFRREDLWIGVFWDHDRATATFDVWICLVPMLPLHIRVEDVPF